MPYDFSMSDKTDQQKAIVAKRKARETEIRDEADHPVVKPPKKRGETLAVDRDSCPQYGHIIISEECAVCDNFIRYIEPAGILCVECSYDITVEG